MFNILNNQTDSRIFMRVLMLRTKRPAENTSTNLFVPENNTNNPLDWSADDTFKLIDPINPMKFNVLADKRYSIGPNDPGTGS